MSDITVSRIYSGDEERSEDKKLVSVREFTELRQREQELTILKQVFSRVVRHSVRNELGPTRGQLEVIQAKTDESLTTTVLESTDRLLSHAGKARAVERVIDTKQTTARRSVQKSVFAVVAEYRQAYPDTDITATQRRHGESASGLTGSRDSVSRMTLIRNVPSLPGLDGA